jgi:hypothetical protein
LRLALLPFGFALADCGQWLVFGFTVGLWSRLSFCLPFVAIN